MTALKAYTGSLATEDSNKTVLISTIVQVLNYLSVQHGQEIKENVLALFRVSTLKNKLVFEHALNRIPDSYSEYVKVLSEFFDRRFKDCNYGNVIIENIANH